MLIEQIKQLVAERLHLLKSRSTTVSHKATQRIMGAATLLFAAGFYYTAQLSPHAVSIYQQFFIASCAASLYVSWVHQNKPLYWLRDKWLNRDSLKQLKNNTERLTHLLYTKDSELRYDQLLGVNALLVKALVDTDVFDKYLQSFPPSAEQIEEVMRDRYVSIYWKKKNLPHSLYEKHPDIVVLDDLFFDLLSAHKPADKFDFYGFFIGFKTLTLHQFEKILSYLEKDERKLFMLHVAHHVVITDDVSKKSDDISKLLEEVQLQKKKMAELGLEDLELERASMNLETRLVDAQKAEVMKDSKVLVRHLQKYL